MRGQKVKLKDGQAVTIKVVQGALLLVVDQKGDIKWIEQDEVDCLMS